MRRAVVDAGCPIGTTEYRLPREQTVLRSVLNKVAPLRTNAGNFCVPDNQTHRDAFKQKLTQRVDALPERKKVTLAAQMRCELDKSESEVNQDNLTSHIDDFLQELSTVQNEDEVDDVVRVFEGDFMRTVSNAMKGGLRITDSEDEQDEQTLGGGARTQTFVVERTRAAKACSVLDIARRYKHRPLFLKAINLYLVQQRFAILMLLEAQRRLDKTNQQLRDDQFGDRNVVDVRASPIRTLLVPVELKDSIIERLIDPNRSNATIDPIAANPKYFQFASGQKAIVAPQVVRKADGTFEIANRFVQILGESDTVPNAEDQDIAHGAAAFDADTNTVDAVKPGMLVSLTPIEEVNVERLTNVQDGVRTRQHMYTIAVPEPNIVIWLKKVSGDVVRVARGELLNELLLHGRDSGRSNVRKELKRLADELHNHFMFTPEKDNRALGSKRHSKLGAIYWAHLLRRSRKCIEEHDIHRRSKNRTYQSKLRVQLRPSSEAKQILSCLNSEPVAEETMQELESLLAGGCRGGARDEDDYDSDRSVRSEFGLDGHSDNDSEIHSDVDY